jgi:hypothetical protein
VKSKHAQCFHFQKSYQGLKKTDFPFPKSQLGLSGALNIGMNMFDKWALDLSRCLNSVAISTSLPQLIPPAPFKSVLPQYSQLGRRHMVPLACSCPPCSTKRSPNFFGMALKAPSGIAPGCLFSLSPIELHYSSFSPYNLPLPCCVCPISSWKFSFIPPVFEI